MAKGKTKPARRKPRAATVATPGGPLPDALVAAAGRFTVARAARSRQVGLYFAAAQPLDDDTFWRILAAYRRRLLDHLARAAKPGPGVARKAAAELVGRAEAESATVSGRHGGGLFGRRPAATLAAFVLRYEALDEQLAAAIDAADRVRTGKGDDAFSDLCDALPLAGRVVCERILTGSFASWGDLEDGIREAAVELIDAAMESGDPGVVRWPPNLRARLREFITDGESSHGTALFDAVTHYLTRLAADAAVRVVRRRRAAGRKAKKAKSP